MQNRLQALIITSYCVRNFFGEMNFLDRCDQDTKKASCKRYVTRCCLKNASMAWWLDVSIANLATLRLHLVSSRFIANPLEL